MSFRVITLEPNGSNATSSVFETEEDAVDFACDLIGEGVVVLRIADGCGVVVRDADEVKAWCAARRRRGKPR